LHIWIRTQKEKKNMQKRSQKYEKNNIMFGSETSF